MLAGYRKGWFAMPALPPLYQWYSPDPRGVLPLDGLRVTRSLRQSARRYTVTYDQDFHAVVALCADPRRAGGWIDRGMYTAYTTLYHLGHAHSVETRDADGRLVGGLFVVNIGGLVCGESMFHTATDASKVALLGLVQRLRIAGRPVLLDTQWSTPHLQSLGVVDIPRADYLRTLAEVIDAPAVW
jgi:leucyl/phenylalanyl-tRNA--protein transferase